MKILPCPWDFSNLEPQQQLPFLDTILLEAESLWIVISPQFPSFNFLLSWNRLLPCSAVLSPFSGREGYAAKITYELLPCVYSGEKVYLFYNYIHI